MENRGSYRSDQFQNNPMSHKGESKKSFRGETLISLEVFEGFENAGTPAWREGWMEKGYYRDLENHGDYR